MKIQETSSSRFQQKNEGQDFYNSKLRLKIGQQPFYIGPKINDNYMGSEPQMVSQTEQNSSMGIPKFHSPSINNSMVFYNMNQSQMKQEIIHQIHEFQNEKEKNNSLKIFIIQLIIWLLYFIGSIGTSYSEITPYQIIDCIGNGISLIFIIYTIYSNKSLKSVSEILHIWSIILTVTILVYPQKNSLISDSDRTFIKAIHILRTLRLLFPLLDGNLQFEKIKKGYFNVYKLRRITLCILVWLFIVGLIYYQLFSDSEGNRCRTSKIPQDFNQNIPIDRRLCGQRKCSQNFFCTNPKTYGLNITQQQKNIKITSSILFNFDSSIESMFSLFQIFTLNGWGKITQTYFDIYPGFISVPFFILGFIVFQFLSFALILIFLEVHKQERQQKNPLIRKCQQNRFSFNPQNFAVQDIKININDNSVNPLGSYKTFALNNNQKQKLQQQQQSTQNNDRKKVLLYGLLILYTIIHYAIASQFGLNPPGFNQDLYNRKIGITLSIFFIIHFITLNLIKFEFLDSKEDDQNESFMESNIGLKQKDYKNNLHEQITEIILKFEYFIFFMLLSDYVLRLIEGKYILQESSGLTSLCHFLLGLRFYYIIMALVDIFDVKMIKNHTLLVIKTVISGLKFVIIFIILACVLGLISFIIKRKNDTEPQNVTEFIYEINRIFMFLINHSWRSLYNLPVNHQESQQNQLYVKIVGGICLFFGSVIFLTYFISFLINEAFWQDISQNLQKTKNYSNNDKQVKNNQDNKVLSLTKQQERQDIKILQQQKSFYVFSYENCLRQTALNIIKEKYYQQTIRFRFYIVYLVTIIICVCFADDKTYGIISAVLEGFILLDIITTALAFRFFGKFSYSQNKFFPIVHFLASILIIILSLTEFQLHLVPFLQINRALLVFNYFQSFQQTFTIIQKLYQRFILHFLILIPILLGYTTIQLLLLSNQTQNLSFSQKLLESFKISLILFTQKGWNLNLIFGQNALITLFGQLSLSSLLTIWIVFSVSFFCSLTGIILSHLVRQKRDQEEQMKESLCGSNILLQQMKIKEKIKKMKPKFDYHLYGSGFLLKFCTINFFQVMKKICLISCFICYLVIDVDLSTQQRVTLYSIHLFFFTIELLLFILQSICYKCNQEYFWRDMILNILAIPGSYIGFVNPVRYSNQSYELKIILQLFNALTALRFIKIISYFKVFHKIYQLICVKLSKTLHIFALIFVMTCSVTGYLYFVFQRKEPILNCLNYALIGLIGGDFHSTLQIIAQRNYIPVTYQLHLVYFLVHLSTQIFDSLLTAVFIFQVSQIIKQSKTFRNTDLSLYNFNKIFHQNQFLDQWMKIDPHGKGFVNFKLILQKSHLFIRHFSVSTFPYKSFYSRVQTFKKLNLQIFQAETTFQNENEKNSQLLKEYVITFYDFLYALSKYVFKEINTPKLVDKGGFFIKNQNQNQQPISFLNINSGGFELMMNGQKKDDKLQQKSEELKEMWRKQSYFLVKQILKERQQQHSEIEGINSVLKSTNLQSQEIYYAYRVKGKILRFLKQIKMKNLTKGNEDGFNLKSKK